MTALSEPYEGVASEDGLLLVEGRDRNETTCKESIDALPDCRPAAVDHDHAELEIRARGNDAVSGGRQRLGKFGCFRLVLQDGHDCRANDDHCSGMPRSS